MRFVVTGSGRCGTHYLATLLTEAGVKCTHEMVYRWYPEPDPWGDQVADSSLMAVPYLGDYPTVLLVRHPLKVVRSWVEVGMFGWAQEKGPHYNAGHDVIRAYAPWVYSYTAVHDRALASWVALTTGALPYAEMVIQIERFDRPQFERLLAWAGEGGDPSAFDRVGHDTNPLTWNRRRTGVTWDPSWDQHDPELAKQAQDLARQLGVSDET